MKQNVAVEKSHMPWLLNLGAFSNVSRSGLIVLTIFMLVVVGANALAYSRWNAETVLDREGEIVEGTVVNKRTVDRQRSRNGVSVTYYIAYSYMDDEGEIHDDEESVSPGLYNRTRLRGPIDVTILPDDPEINRLEPGTSGFRFVSQLMSVFLGILFYIWVCNAYAYMTLPEAPPVDAHRHRSSSKARTKWTPPRPPER